MGTVVGATFAFPFKDFESEAVTKAKAAFADGARIEPAALRFLEQMHEDAIAEDLEDLTVEDMVALAAGFWAWGKERGPGETKIRLAPGARADGAPIGREILEIITSDKPFLVDSVMGEINDEGVDVLAMFHPLVAVERDAKGKRVEAGAPTLESMIQVHLEPLDEEARERLLAGLRATLCDVDVAVADYAAMRTRMDQVIDELKTAPSPASREEIDECIAFLRWLRDEHFAFLGCRVYEFAADKDGGLLQEEPVILEETGRGVLRDPNRHVLRRGSEPAIITPAIREFLGEPTPLIVAKSNVRSRVHRRVYMDYIGVKRYRADGEVTGETRFVGLFTAEAYNEPADEVPLLRRKVRRVLERADKKPGSHNYKRLQNIVATYPRDELFQSEEDELLQISLGVLHLFDRPRPKLFVRRDRFDRFLSAFVFVPRERYTSDLRIQIGDLLTSAFAGRLSAYYPAFSDGPLARVHFIIGLDPFNHPEPDPAVLERRITELARTWEDAFIRVGRRSAARALRPALLNYESAFSAGYREAFTPEEGLEDAASIEGLDAEVGVGVRLYRREGDGADLLRFKVFRIGEPLALSDVLPTFENMGLRVASELSYAVRRAARGEEAEREPLPVAWVHDFVMTAEREIDLGAAKTGFEDSFLAVWTGRNENDGFNRLVLGAGVGWRDVCFLRACAKWRQQTGLDPSQQVQEDAFADNPEIIDLILELKRVRLDPAVKGDLKKRAAKAKEIEDQIVSALDAVQSLDADRVLRRVARLVSAVQRTNFYQTAADGAPPAHLALKIASREIEELPLPKPYREIFVWSPQVEGVHIRFGPIARGGLRWSDRRDDFRTEVLGLVKAQQVKNAVIVPVGAKGGFFPKLLPRGGTREEVQAEGVSAYKTFISALLDVTDNLIDDAVRHPDDTVIWDGEDPYLVVAADKGTASFSDTANAIATTRGFWLGDAFASGGSAGYDHKKMAITARGAWEAVKRHFRELDKDIQAQEFTVIGVGDMSGDVFGNGMLLSKKIRLVAAFDHRDIFIDPNPGDPGKLWAERKRMFELPRSSWKDYDQSLISKGGGVFSRSLKSIPLSPEIKALAGLKGDAAAPQDLMHALLKTPCELLWFGGIGTYVKAAGEQHWQVGDRANDLIRVDADDVGGQVVGEGANLGVTMAGRVALARRGVKLNADFVDNAAGVDCSDHEVNIKILLSHVMRQGDMDMPARNALLHAMTGDVASHVLKHNYDQTLAISIAEATAAGDLDAHERLIERLEARGRLNRSVEGLPSAEQFRELKAQNEGLTRPEIAVLVSYAKLSLFDRLVESSVPDDPYFDAALRGYFPEALGAYGDEMRRHRLKREIIATVLANDIVNLGGATFNHRARESTGADTDAVARGFEAARAIFGFSELLGRIHALDNKAPADVQTQLYREIIRLLRRQAYWLVRRGRGFEDGAPTPLAETIEAYRPGVETLRAFATDVISPFEKERVETRAKNLVAAGAPKDIARDVAGLRPLTSSSDVIDLAAARGWPLEAAARLYHAFGHRFRFDVLRAAAGGLSSSVHWDRLAVRRLIEDLYAEQQRLVERAMDVAEASAKAKPADAFAKVDRDWAGKTVATWLTCDETGAARVDEVMEELEAAGPWTLSKLTIAATTLREFGARATS